jgi:hypothetical protein
MCQKKMRPNGKFPHPGRHFPFRHFSFATSTWNPFSSGSRPVFFRLVFQIQSSSAPVAMTVRLNQIVRPPTFPMHPPGWSSMVSRVGLEPPLEQVHFWLHSFQKLL